MSRSPSSLVAISLAALLAACSPPQASQTPVRHPSAPSATNTSAAPQLSEGKAAIERGDFAAAADLFRKALRRDPASAKAHYYLGVCLEHLGNLAEAEKSYRASIDHDPSLTDATVNLSALLIDQKRYADAIDLLTKATSKTPKDPLLRTNLAYAKLYMNDLPGAETEFKRAIALHATADARLGLASCFGAQGKKDQLVEQVRQATSSPDATVQTLVTGAEMFRKAGAFNQCVLAYDRALQQKKLPELLVRRGVCKQRDKQMDAAKADFVAATKLEPHFGPAFFWLGKHLLDIDHDRKGAIQAFETCARVAPKSHCKQEAENAKKAH